MQKKIVYISIFVIAAIIQLSFLPVVATKYAAADVVLMLVLAWSILDGFFAFFSWAIFLGFLYDLISYSAVGTHALIFLIVLYFVSFFSRRFSVELKGAGLVLFLLFVLVATFISNGVIALILAWKMETVHNFWKSFGSPGYLLIQFAYNVVLFFLCFIVIKKAKQFFAIAD